jgi:hypothetical protein
MRKMGLFRIFAVNPLLARVKLGRPGGSRGGVILYL